MPYLSSQIPIAGTQYDRRRKLTEDQKEYIKWLRNEEHLSYNQLAKMFNVSKRLITFICNPDMMAKHKERSKKYRAEGRYKPSSEEWASTIREHRRYKQQLKLEGKI